jgi:hypothetical protein
MYDGRHVLVLSTAIWLVALCSFTFKEENTMDTLRITQNIDPINGTGDALMMFRNLVLRRVLENPSAIAFDADIDLATIWLQHTRLESRARLLLGLPGYPCENEVVDINRIAAWERRLAPVDRMGLLLISKTITVVPEAGRLFLLKKLRFESHVAGPRIIVSMRPEVKHNRSFPLHRSPALS